MNVFLQQHCTKPVKLYPMRLLILAFSLCGIALLAQDAPKPAAPAFKNLKVLKPADIRAAMGMATSGLGVQCSECHVQGDNSLDDKPAKVTARMMFQMTQEINAKFPDGKMHVSCYSCHRGQKEPLMAAPKA